jgi:hypothetical protein
MRSARCQRKTANPTSSAEIVPKRAKAVTRLEAEPPTMTDTLDELLVTVVDIPDTWRSTPCDQLGWRKPIDLRRPAGGNLPKDRSVPSDRIDTGTAEPGDTNPTRKRGTLAEAST